MPLIRPPYLWDTLQPEKGFFEAIKNGDKVRFLYLIKRGVNGGTKDNNDLPALVCAAVHNREEFILPLLQNGAEVNSKSGNGATALHCAALFGHTSVVKTLLENGADIEAVEDIGWTPLHSAATGQQDEAARVLLDHGANIHATTTHGCTVLHQAAMQGHRGTIYKTFVDAGVDIDAKDIVGKTALHWAASEGNSSAVDTLLLQGANVLLKDGNGRTARQSVGTARGGCDPADARACKELKIVSGAFDRA